MQSIPSTAPAYLSPQSVRRIIAEGMMSQMMESLTTGVLLVGMALHFGASNLVIGILGAIPFLCNLTQIPAIYLLERFPDRRKFVVWASFCGRFFLLCVALTPFLPDNDSRLIALTGFMLVRYAIGCMASCAWNSWMRDLIPDEMLGDFFARRQFFVTLMGVALSIASAYFIQLWDSYLPNYNIYGYSLLFFIGFIAAMVSTFLVRTLPHPPMMEHEAHHYEEELSSREMLFKPLKEKNFRKLIISLALWNFALNLAAPFFSVYILKTLGYSMKFVILITLLSQVVNAISLNLWGRYTDNFSNKTVLGICGMVFILAIFGWTYTSMPGKYGYTTELLIGLHIIMGMAMAGITLSSSNIALKLSPRRHATVFLAVNSIISSVAAGLAPITAGIAVSLFEEKRLFFTMDWQTGHSTASHTVLSLEQWDFIFVAAFLLGLYALKRLVFIREKGAVRRHVVIRELMLDSGRALRSISTVSGLRSVTVMPLVMLASVLRKRK